MASHDESLGFWAYGKTGASEGHLDAAESHVGHKLPAAFRELLLKSSGGISVFSGFDRGGEFFPMLPVLGVDPSASVGTLMRAHDVRASFDVPDDVVVFAAQGEAWWGLDYRGGGSSPAIIYCDDPSEGVFDVADDFDEFLAGLVE